MRELRLFVAVPLVRSWKLCWRCRRLLPLSAFYRDRAKADGRQTACRECQAGLIAAWRALNLGTARDDVRASGRGKPSGVGEGEREW